MNTQFLSFKVGGADQFEPFLRAYFEKFKPKSISTGDFKEYNSQVYTRTS